jgi:hypothetical protein
VYWFRDKKKKKKFQKIMTSLAQRRMRRSSAYKATSLAFASSASLQEASLTLTPM